MNYLISEASRLVGVEAHVLRYWEEELSLHIGRTDQGHRYYTEEDIRLLQTIRRLKEQGIQLKAVKTLLEEDEGADEMESWLRERLLDEKVRPAGEAGLDKPEEDPEEPDDENIEGGEEFDAADECAVALTGSVEPAGNRMAQFEQILENVVERVMARSNEELEDRFADILRQQLKALEPPRKKSIWPFGRNRR